MKFTTTSSVTVQSRNGSKTVETPYDDEEAINLLVERVGNGLMHSAFARSLAEQYDARGLSSKQVAWVQVLVVEFEQQMAPSDAVRVGHALIQRFDEAAENLKYPKIKFHDLPGIGNLKLVRSGAKSKRPGTIAVTDGKAFGENKYYGHISRDGLFVTARDCTAAVSEFVQEFGENPVEVAALYGQRVGSCCFCARELTDERSTTVGYGPICADHFGLPWGEEA